LYITLYYLILRIFIISVNSDAKLLLRTRVQTVKDPLYILQENSFPVAKKMDVDGGYNNHDSHHTHYQSFPGRWSWLKGVVLINYYGYSSNLFHKILIYDITLIMPPILSKLRRTPCLNSPNFSSTWGTCSA